MKYDADAGIPTLRAALFDYMNSDDRRKLGALTKQKLPSRKGDLADVIMRHLEPEGCRFESYLRPEEPALGILSSRRLN